ncbi:MAG: hypothetical protein GEV06_01910 [Luteitalea sp.]|nr:hypothetical protein [Luteitalea sp.]
MLRIGLTLVAALVVVTVRAAPSVQTTFTGTTSEHTWLLEELDRELPSDWTPYEFLVLELKASSSQRFELGLETTSGRVTKRIHPLAGVWVRASIPLRFYRSPAGDGIDLAATFHQPRGSYWINLGSSRHGPTTEVRALTVIMHYPVASPTLEIRSVSLAKVDPGDAVLEGNPLVDELGQYAHAEWPGKVQSLDDLKGAWAAEDAALQDDASNDRCPYGGSNGSTNQLQDVETARTTTSDSSM